MRALFAILLMVTVVILVSETVYANYILGSSYGNTTWPAYAVSDQSGVLKKHWRTTVVGPYDEPSVTIIFHEPYYVDNITISLRNTYTSPVLVDGNGNTIATTTTWDYNGWYAVIAVNKILSGTYTVQGAVLATYPTSYMTDEGSGNITVSAANGLPEIIIMGRNLTKAESLKIYIAKKGENTTYRYYVSPAYSIIKIPENETITEGNYTQIGYDVDGVFVDVIDVITTTGPNRVTGITLNATVLEVGQTLQVVVETLNSGGEVRVWAALSYSRNKLVGEEVFYDNTLTASTNGTVTTSFTPHRGNVYLIVQAETFGGVDYASATVLGEPLGLTGDTIIVVTNEYGEYGGRVVDLGGYIGSNSTFWVTDLAGNPLAWDTLGRVLLPSPLEPGDSFVILVRRGENPFPEYSIELAPDLVAGVNASVYKIPVNRSVVFYKLVAQTRGGVIVLDPRLLGNAHLADPSLVSVEPQGPYGGLPSYAPFPYNGTGVPPILVYVPPTAAGSVELGVKVGGT